jgi:trk system potassium uptake protein
VPIRRILSDVGNPARFVLGAFVALIATGAALLSLPFAVDGPERLSATDAVFMSTSAATVTGLATVDISAFSLFGELVLLALIQIGGFGIMTIGAVAVLVTFRKVGLRGRILAREEIGAVDMGDLKSLVMAIAKFTVVFEAAVALVLFARFLQRGGEAVGNPLYSAVFHSISGFNNAGISLYSDSLERFVGDPVVIVAMTFAFIVGGLGFPILIELRRRMRPRRWSLHARVTLMATLGLLLTAPLVIMAFEWTNPGTLGPLATGDKLLAGWFTGATPRTAGFDVVPTSELNEPTLLFVTTLMFIGAGPASTSGGIKITTFAVLAFVLWSEVRGEPDVNAFRRRIPPHIVRRAITVALLSVGLVVGTALVLVSITDLTVTPTLFEAASAFGTVGLSTGITADLPVGGQMLLVVVMLAGRVGVITFVTALALRRRTVTYHYPEEQPIIG